MLRTTCGICAEDAMEFDVMRLVAVVARLGLGVVDVAAQSAVWCRGANWAGQSCRPTC
jgi:hypothetical protein